MLRYRQSMGAAAVCAAVVASAPACGQGVAVESDNLAEHQVSLDRACHSITGNAEQCPVLAIAAGGYFTCALLVEGQVKCWGESAYGDLGLGDESHRGVLPGDMGAHLPPVDLGTGRTALSIAAGFAHACALLDNGSVKCWGHNSLGQLGLGDDEDRGDGPGEMGDALPAVDLGAKKPVIALAAGSDHTCALFEGGRVKCWGFNYSGQLGSGDRRKRGSSASDMGDALPFVDLGPGRKARAIAAGGSRTCALLEGGDVKCWGDNSNGGLGLGDRHDRGGAPGEMGVHLRTVDLGDDLIPLSISAGVGFGCAVTTGGVKCWGDNEEGRLGLGDTKNRGDLPDEMGDSLPFVDLGSGVHASAVVNGAMHACALVGHAGVKCWGDNYEGQLGLGDAKNRGDDPGEMGDALPAVNLGSPD